jgi:hypothetical protein
MVFWIFGACLMAIFNVHFAVTVKWQEMFWVGKKKRNSLYYLLYSVQFSFTMPLIAALQFVRISIFFDLPQQALCVACIDGFWESTSNICQLQHAVAWIVLAIVFVMIMMMMMIIIIIITILITIIVTIIIIEYAVSSVTNHIQITIFIWLN